MRHDPEPREKRPVQLYAESHRKLMELAAGLGLSAAQVWEKAIDAHVTKQLAKMYARKAKGAA